MSSKTKMGGRIRAARKALGLSQSSLAGKIAVTQEWMCRIEGGSGSAGLETMILLAMHLNVSVDYLLNGNSKTTKPKQPKRKSNGKSN